MDGEFPGLDFVLLRFGRRVMGKHGLGSRIQVVKQAKRVVPLQGHMFVLQPGVCPRDFRVDEVGIEEGVQLGKEECKIGKSGEVKLCPNVRES